MKKDRYPRLSPVFSWMGAARNGGDGSAVANPPAPMPAEENANPYQAAGTFDGISYVERRADEKLLSEILENRRYPYLLAPRQSGKSSLLAHVMNKLDSTRFQTVFVDISTLVDCLESSDVFLKAFNAEIASVPDMPDERDGNRNPGRTLKSILKAVAARRGRRVIIFVDEIERLVDTKFKDYFFGLIRSFFNQRTTDKNVDFRLVQFVLSGAAQPTELMSTENASPFNVGAPVILEDLSFDEATEMTRYLRTEKSRVAAEVESEIYRYTNGSVYLTQLFLEQLWKCARSRTNREITTHTVARVAAEIVRESVSNIHFLNIHSNITAKPDILKAFQDLAAKHPAGKHPAGKQETDYLRMTGITGDERVYRNLMYEYVFEPCGPLSLFDTHMKDGECGAILDMRMGGRKGFGVLYKRHAGDLKKRLMLRHKVSEDLADEVLNIVFLRFYEKIKQFRGKCSAYTWLCTLAHNEMINRLLETNGRREVSLMLNEEQETNPHDMEDALCYERCVRRALKQAMRGPYAECLEALTLSVMGLSMEEIAASMDGKADRSVGAMRYFLHGCRKKLKQHTAFKECWEGCRE
ncbi:MAG: hypothetical protein GY862_39075 [Gammaproteobacteria bacterium]|nr:hypothetical protein [Gammaproteobacteria bacterium]